MMISGIRLGAAVGVSLALLLAANAPATAKDKSGKCKDAPSPVPQTGLDLCWDALGNEIFCAGTGQDGEFQTGVAWPIPRFTQNGDGTVGDNLTGLIWLEDANCFGLLSWSNALSRVNALFDGCIDCGGTDSDCGLSDGSLLGMWRLPNVQELASLSHFGVYSPALPNTAGTGKWAEGDPFSDVQPSFYWSSTSRPWWPPEAWGVWMDHGHVSSVHKSGLTGVWPVRSGQ